MYIGTRIQLGLVNTPSSGGVGDGDEGGGDEEEDG